MNKQQRTELAKLTRSLENFADEDELKAACDTEAKLKEVTGKLDDAKSVAEGMRDEEEEKYDNLTEGLQQSERGQAIEAAKEALDNAATAFESAVSSLEKTPPGYSAAASSVGEACGYIDEC